MSIVELYRARQEGRFGLKHWLIAWIISTRLFACPRSLLACLFGALLAQYNGYAVNWSYVLYAILVTQAFLLACHFVNNYRDYLRGLDRDVDISKVKPYSAASALVPLGITPIWFQRVNALIFTAVGIVAAIPLVTGLSWGWQQIPVVLLGLALAWTYTDFFKPRGLGEIAVFLGQGVGTELCGYLSVAPLTLDSWWKVLVAMLPIALDAAFSYSFDQYQDTKSDFTKRVKNLAVLLWRSEVPVGPYMVACYSFELFTVHFGVTLGVLPTVCLALLLPTWPIMLVLSAYTNVNSSCSLKIFAFLFINLLPLLMCLGVCLA